MLAPFLALAAWGAAAPAFGARPITPPAPEFPSGLTWLNSEALSLARLRHKQVVLVSFVDFASLNSIRTFPVLRTWWERYSTHGLTIILVHTPDFGFTRDPLYVRGALKRFNLRMPAILDNGRALWRAYQNEGWPASYLIDPNGLIAYDRLGEGGYGDFELEIREALRNLDGYVPPDDLKPADNPSAADCQESTPVLWVGARRGRQMSLEGVKEQRNIIATSRDGEIAYKGRWLLEPEDLRLRRDNETLTDFFRLIYHGAEANAVMNSASGRTVQVFVKQNDLWLHGKNAGQDVRWDDEDRSYILVSEPRVYYVTKNQDDGMQELYFYPSEAGVGVYGFDFSNSCQTQYEHR